MYVYTELGKDLKHKVGIHVEVGKPAMFCGKSINGLGPVTRQWFRKGYIRKES